MLQDLSIYNRLAYLKWISPTDFSRRLHAMELLSLVLVFLVIYSSFEESILFKRPFSIAATHVINNKKAQHRS